MNKLQNSQMHNQEAEQQESYKQFENSLESLIITLQQKWSERNIDKDYQKTILTYLNYLEPSQARLQIFKQYENLKQDNFKGQQISQMKLERQQILDKLQEFLTSQYNNQEVCSSLDQLRKINLRICQSIIDFKQQLGGNDASLLALSQGYGQFLRKLNKDNLPIIKSYLKQYICFTKNYDPFFLYPYEKFQSQGFPQDIPEMIVKLFKMNISYVYRLIKTKKQITAFLQAKTAQQLQLQIQNKCFQQTEQQQQNYMPSQKSYNKQEAYKYQGISRVRKNKFQTIGYDESNQQIEDYNQRMSKSQPRSQSKTIQFQYLKTQKNKRFRRFKLRETSQSQKGMARHKKQNFQVAEDEDINIFRKKMLARKQKRRIINLKQIEQQGQNCQQSPIKPLKRLSLDLKKRSKYLTECSPEIIKNKQIQAQQLNESSSSDQLMEPRNIEQNQTKFSKSLKLNLHNKNLKRITVKKQRIKLSPLDLKNSQKQGQSINSYPSKINVDFKNDSNQLIRKKTYYPLSPVIKQAVNQSSQSSESKLQNTQLNKNNKQQKNIQPLKLPQEQMNQTKPQFRIKKVHCHQMNDHEDQPDKLYKSFVQNSSLKVIDETNEKNFRDIHIRRPKESQSYNQAGNNEASSRNSLNLSITRNFDKSSLRFETSRNTNKDFSSRLQSRKGDIQQYKNQINQQKGQNQKNNGSKKVQEQKILNQIQKELQETKNKKKQIKMKPGQIKLDDLYTFIQRQKINQVQREQFEVGLWKQNINLKHSYLTKFYMNSELAAFGISSPRCDGDYNILYWGTTCTDSFTNFLFGKYIDYLQKFTTLSNIYIGSPAYSYADFQKKGSVYIRKRKNCDKRQMPYIPFLSLQCSNICFQQQKSSQISIFYSQQIEQFTIDNSKTNLSIILCDLKVKNQPKIILPTSGKIYNQKLTIAQVNSILEKLSIDSYAISQKTQINQCKLFAIKDNSSIKSNYFYVRDGYFVPKGIEIYSKQKQKIMRLEMMKEQYFLYFGKFFQTIQSFIDCCGTKKSGPDHFFGFKMFTKQLYGRIKNSQFQNIGCYGNWDINFLWQDQLKGTVIKQMPSSDYLFGPDSFYVAIYKSESLLFSFQVQSSDFFF